MFKVICFFALLAIAFAAPKADPIIPISYTGGAPLTYSYSSPITYDYGYGLAPYAAGYYGSYGYGGLPLAYRNLYI